MNQKLINKAQELRAHGFTTGEIADELNVSLDTARWLILQKTEEEVKEEAPVDFYINWKSLGESSSRLRYASMALSDMAMTHGEVEVVVGIAASGIPFATMIADFLEEMTDLENHFMDLLIDILGEKYKILGVCLGHQSICTAFGATVSYAKELMHGKQSLCDIDTDSNIFKG